MKHVEINMSVTYIRGKPTVNPDIYETTCQLSKYGSAFLITTQKMDLQDGCLLQENSCFHACIFKNCGRGFQPLEASGKMPLPPFFRLK
jgi:hypothetical protein